MIETNHQADGLLLEAGKALIAAAYAFREARLAAGLSGAVVWLKDDRGAMVVFTRGEYRAQIMQNVDHLSRDTFHEFEHNDNG